MDLLKKILLFIKKKFACLLKKSVDFIKYIKKFKKYYLHKTIKKFTFINT